MKNKIDTTNWKEFDLKNLFKFSLPKGDIQVKKCSDGDIPFITPSKTNNGILKYISKEDGTLFEGHCLTVDMFGNAYYQENSFYTVSHGHVNVLTPCQKMSKNVLLFIATSIKIMFQEKYGFNDMCTLKVLQKEKIKLPTNLKGNPDFDYMENYIKSIEEKVQKRIDNISTKKENKNKIDTTNFKTFIVKDLFDIHPTSSYKMTNAQLLDGGENPVLANSSYNNGIGGYSSQKTTEKGNMITFSDTVDANTIFYQENNFIGYSHVQGLYEIGEYKGLWTKYSLLYFASIFKARAKIKGFDYGNKFRRDIALNLDVLLPIDENGKIDFNYMENYMKNIEYKTKGNKIRMKDYYNYNYEEKDIEEYVESRKESYYGFDGLGNYDNGYTEPPCHVYKFYKEDISFEKNTITINVGNYANKKLDYLLKQIFVSRDEMCFDLKRAIETNNTKLILFNNIGNQSKDFFDYINEFFKDYAIDIEKQGIWE